MVNLTLPLVSMCMLLGIQRTLPCLSTFNITDTIPFLVEWNLFFRNFMYGNLVFGDYFDHVLSRWAHRDDENVLFLKFENVKKDLPTAVARIAKFIECDVTDEVITKVVEMT